jgi:RHS repeat-associated protein
VIDGTGYTGHVMDQATGLTYMQQRYYDPQIGRFLSTDPMPTDPNSGANFNRYSYANNNPYGFTDPDGRTALGGGSVENRSGNNGGMDFSMGGQTVSGVDSGYRASTRQQQKREFAKLAAALSQIILKGTAANEKKTELQAALAFAKAAVPFTAKTGREAGANIVTNGAGTLSFEDVALGSGYDVTIPTNSYARADVHTHPVGGQTKLSGYVIFSSGRISNGGAGDYFIAFDKAIDKDALYYQSSYVFGADGTGVRFNAAAFKNDVNAARKDGRNFDGRSYTEAIP